MRSQCRRLARFIRLADFFVADSLFTLALHPDNCESLGVIGGIGAVLRGMKAHPGHGGVQEQGCRVLWNLAPHPINQGAMVVQGTLQVRRCRRYERVSRYEHLSLCWVAPLVCRSACVAAFGSLHPLRECVGCAP